MVSYHNNSISDNTPKTVSAEEGGYEHYQEKIEGKKIRARSDSFKDHFSQAKMFYNSMSDVEKQHIIDTMSFELAKVNREDIKQQVLEMFGNVNTDMITKVAKNIGSKPPSTKEVEYDKVSPALSQANTIKKPDTLKVGILLGNNFNSQQLKDVMTALKAAKTMLEIISETLEDVKGTDGNKVTPVHTLISTDPVILNSLYVLRGENLSEVFKTQAKRYIKETFMHYKPIAVADEMTSLLEKEMNLQAGVTILKGEQKDIDKFIEDISVHRHWNRNINI